jgi:hypothetical protein
MNSIPETTPIKIGPTNAENTDPENTDKKA